MTSLEGWDSAIELHPRTRFDRCQKCTRRGKYRRSVTTLYERVGGQPFFDQLVEEFYDGVKHDPVLRPLYPEGLDDPKRQFWGGPPIYGDERGHPRLRMRHVPFVIGLAERNAWLGHMVDAVRGSGAADEIQTELIEYFEMASRSLINSN
jgi:hemoglobin